MHPRPTFSLIVPTRQRTTQLRRLLDSLAATAARPETIEVVLVVDADDRASIEFRHDALALTHVVCPPGQTMGRLNRAGCAASSGEYLMLLNDDVAARTSGWDDKVLARCRRFPDGVFLIHINDTLMGKNLCTFPIVSAHLVRAGRRRLSVRLHSLPHRRPHRGRLQPAGGAGRTADHLSSGRRLRAFELHRTARRPAGIPLRSACPGARRPAVPRLVSRPEGAGPDASRPHRRRRSAANPRRPPPAGANREPVCPPRPVPTAGRIGCAPCRSPCAIRRPAGARHMEARPLVLPAEGGRGAGESRGATAGRTGPRHDARRQQLPVRGWEAIPGGAARRHPARSGSARRARPSACAGLL